MNNLGPVTFLEGRTTILRPMSPETDPVLGNRWINDPSIRQYLANVYPRQLSNTREFYERSDEHNIVLMIETKDERTPIGTIGLHGINYRTGTATTGTLIDQPYWGKGHGTDAKMALLRYGFLDLNLTTIYTTVLVRNERSRRCQQKCGYRIFGLRPDFDYRDGEPQAAWELVVRRADWLPLWQVYKETGSLPTSGPDLKWDDGLMAAFGEEG
ncbi:GNAT family N-acetyltransferase [Candidatus Berkelbacteria bacterium]|nr:GNAT family N-acetyltransferase [Candidatus Berkelbacteria bacterium]